MLATLPMLLAATGIGIGHAILPDHWMPLALLARARRYPLRRVARLALAAAVTHVAVSVLFGAAVAAVGLRFREAVARHTDLAVGGVLVATGVVLAVLECFGRGHHHDHSHAETECADGRGLAPTGPHLSAQAEHGSGGHAVATLERSVAAVAGETRRRRWLGRFGGARTGAGLRRRAPMAFSEPAGSAAEPRHTRLAQLAPFAAAASPDLTILPLFLAAGALGVGPALAVLAVFTLATTAVMVGLTMAAATGANRLTAPWIEERATALTAATLVAIGALVVTGIL